MFFWRKNTWAHRIGHSVFTHKKDYCTVFFGEKNHCDGEKKTLYTTEVFADAAPPPPRRIGCGEVAEGQGEKNEKSEESEEGEDFKP